MMAEPIWEEKYRPNTIEGYVYPNDRLRQSVEKILKTGFLPNLLFSGTPGVGKTTLAKILINDLGLHPKDVLYVNASSETQVEYVRTTLKLFSETYPFGTLKLIVLDEADQLSKHAQKALKGIIERDSDTCRFLFIANNPNKIDTAMKSRLIHWVWPRPKLAEVLPRVKHVLDNETVEYTDENVMDYIRLYYPDIRKIVQLVQHNVFDGELKNAREAIGADWEFELIDAIKQRNFAAVYQLVATNASMDEYDRMFKLVFQNTTNPSDIIIIGAIYRNLSFVADPEIIFAELCFKLAATNK